VQVAVQDGAEKPIPGPSWLNLAGMCWLPDGTGLLVTARDPETRLLQIWLVNFADGKRRRVTNDLSNYHGISITADGQTVASVQSEVLSNIWVALDGDPSRARRITFQANKDEGLSGLSLTPDGRIVYSARALGIWDLWIVDRDGKNNRQLTLNTRGNFWPSVTPDGRYIVFTSLRTGTPYLWRIGLDGENPKQLTDGAGMDGRPIFTPDGKWVIYEKVGAGRESTLWKVSIDGGSPIQLTEQSTDKAAISPDGKFIAARYQEKNGPAKVVVISSDGGAPLRVLESIPIVNSSTVRWSPDGRSLIYIDSRDRVYNLWAQPVSGGPPKPLTNFSSDRIFGFDISPDGKVFALARGHEMSDVVLISSFK
jgi:Tol biopolymer transport system component